MGCFVLCNRTVLCGSEVRVSVPLPNRTPVLSIDLGTIKWVQGQQFGVEFLRLHHEARQRLNRTRRIELIEMLETHWDDRELPALLNRES